MFHHHEAAGKLGEHGVCVCVGAAGCQPGALSVNV